MLNQLASGTYSGPVRAGYGAGSPGLDNPNFVRDLGAIGTWDPFEHGDTGQTLAFLGTYEMHIIATNVDPVNRTATLVYHGANTTSLGSALRFGGQNFYDFLNRLPIEGGPLSAVRQEWLWREDVAW